MIGKEKDQKIIIDLEILVMIEGVVVEEDQIEEIRVEMMDTGEMIEEDQDHREEIEDENN